MGAVTFKTCLALFWCICSPLSSLKALVIATIDFKYKWKMSAVHTFQNKFSNPSLIREQRFIILFRIAGEDEW